jgi:hypothetical protein
MERPNTNDLVNSFTNPIFSSLAVGAGTGISVSVDVDPLLMTFYQGLSE